MRMKVDTNELLLLNLSSIIVQLINTVLLGIQIFSCYFNLIVLGCPFIFRWKFYERFDLRIVTVPSVGLTLREKSELKHVRSRDALVLVPGLLLAKS